MACTNLQQRCPRPGIIDAVNRPSVVRTLCQRGTVHQRNPDEYINCLTKHEGPSLRIMMPSRRRLFHFDVRFFCVTSSCPGYSPGIMRIANKP